MEISKSQSEVVSSGPAVGRLREGNGSIDSLAHPAGCYHQSIADKHPSS